MKNLEIVDGKLDWYDDEKEKIEEFVAKRKGKILWGYIAMMIKEDGKKVIDHIPWINRQGFIMTPLADI